MGGFCPSAECEAPLRRACASARLAAETDSAARASAATQETCAARRGADAAAPTRNVAVGCVSRARVSARAWGRRALRPSSAVPEPAIARGFVAAPSTRFLATANACRDAIRVPSARSVAVTRARVSATSQTPRTASRATTEIRAQRTTRVKTARVKARGRTVRSVRRVIRRPAAAWRTRARTAHRVTTATPAPAGRRA